MASLSQRVLSGSLIFLLANFLQRSIGLVSTLILARLLVPEDFAIVAICTLIIHFCDILSNSGSESYLIQKNVINRDDINSAWTLDFFFKIALWGLLVAVVPFIASFYEMPDINNALYASSLVLLLGSIKSPSIAILKRDLEYKKIFILNVSRKVISFLIVVGIALYKPSYWAIIVGDLAAALVLTAGSYLIYSYKPRICFKKIKEQFQFSKWILLKSGVGYSKAQLDVFFVGKIFSTELLGIYHMARHISIMPSTDIIAPSIEPLLASFSKEKNNIPRLNYQLCVSFVAVCAMVVPAAIFILNFANSIISVLLGDQWSAAVLPLQALTLFLP